MVAALAISGLAFPEEGASQRIFPEPLSPFSTRAASMLFLALALGAAPILSDRVVAARAA